MADNDEYSRHEALHLSHVFAETVETHLLHHPVIQAHSRASKLVGDAVAKLNECYQLIGAAHLGDLENPWDAEFQKGEG